MKIKHPKIQPHKIKINLQKTAPHKNYTTTKINSGTRERRMNE
jgi:hypothetical protein